MSQAGIGVYDTYSEKLNILIYNQTFAKGFIRLLNKDVNMDEPKGIFFWGAWRDFSAGIFPPIIFVRCYAKKMWISPTYTPMT